jgi:nucleoid-associated protein YgaU
MSDVEKYGLFAVVFVGGLLLLIAVQGGFGDESEVASVAPVVIDAVAFGGVDEPALKPGAERSMLTAADSMAPAPGPRSLRMQSHLSDEDFRWKAGPGPYPGERSVRIPSTQPGAPAQLFSPQPATAVPATYTVVAGDTLGEISLRVLGTSRRAPEIYEANRAQMKSEDDLSIGQVLVMPGAAKPTAREQRANRLSASTNTQPVTTTTMRQAAGRSHTVQSGDTLGEISLAYLGTSRRSGEIFEANRDVLKSPDALVVGQVLAIP